MALTLSATFFILSNLVVTPFYLLMLVAPRAGLTRRMMGSVWPIALPSLVHVAFVALIFVFTRPDVIGLWRALYVEYGLLSPATIEFLSRTYGTFPEFATLHGWVHVVTGDLVMARWAYLDALERNLPAWLIAIVTLLIGFIGPIGAVIYLVVRRGYRGLGQSREGRMRLM